MPYGCRGGQGGPPSPSPGRSPTSSPCLRFFGMISDAGSGFGVFLLVLGAGHSLGGTGDPSSCSPGPPSPSWASPSFLEGAHPGTGHCAWSPGGGGAGAQSCSHWAQGQARGGPRPGFPGPGELAGWSQAGDARGRAGFRGASQRGCSMGPSWAEEGPERAGGCSGGVLSASEVRQKGQLSRSEVPPVSLPCPQPSLAPPHGAGPPLLLSVPGLRARIALRRPREAGVLERTPCLTGAGGLLRGSVAPRMP